MPRACPVEHHAGPLYPLVTIVIGCHGAGSWHLKSLASSGPDEARIHGVETGTGVTLLSSFQVQGWLGSYLQARTTTELQAKDHRSNVQSERRVLVPRQGRRVLVASRPRLIGRSPEERELQRAKRRI